MLPASSLPWAMDGRGLSINATPASATTVPAMKSKRFDRRRRIRTILGLLVVLAAGFAGAELGRHHRARSDAASQELQVTVPACGPAGNYCIGDLLAAIR